MVNTSLVGRAFWNGKSAKGSFVHSTGDKLFSYGTVILQRMPDGKVIGNKTKYSQTTSKHQSQVNMLQADYFVHRVDRGVTDLVPYLNAGEGPRTDRGWVHGKPFGRKKK